MLKKTPGTYVFCEFCEICKKTFFNGTPPVAASVKLIGDPMYCKRNFLQQSHPQYKL